MIKEKSEEPFLYLLPRTNLKAIDYDFQLKMKSSTSPQMSWLILTDDWLLVVARHIVPFDSLER